MFGVICTKNLRFLEDIVTFSGEVCIKYVNVLLPSLLDFREFDARWSTEPLLEVEEVVSMS